MTSATVIATRAPPASGCLFVLAAPSGGGKTSLVKALLEREPGMRLSVSYTTREPRPGERDGVDYHFVDEAKFMALKNAGEFLEHAYVHGNWYATSATWLAKEVQAGHDMLLEIDWQGAQQVKKRFRNAVEIFILPPSLDALEERLKKRGQDSPNVIVRRLLAAGSEMAHAPEAQYVLINENFERALAELRCLVAATRLRFGSQYARHTQLFVELGIHSPHAE